LCFRGRNTGLKDYGFTEEQWKKAGKGGGRQDFLQARLWNAVILIIWDDCAPLCANFGKDNADPNKAVRLAENHFLFLPFF